MHFFQFLESFLWNYWPESKYMSWLTKVLSLKQVFVTNQSVMTTVPLGNFILKTLTKVLICCPLNHQSLGQCTEAFNVFIHRMRICRIRSNTYGVHTCTCILECNLDFIETSHFLTACYSNSPLLRQSII